MQSITPSISALRTALRTPGSLLVDLLIVAAVVSLVGGLIAYGEQFSAPFAQKTEIDLSWTALPVYTFFSLCRGFAAYAVSLTFTLLFATAAARSARSERAMLPILDVLQSIPVLGFLPGLVLGMIALFPTREIGLEIACIIMIFTGQAWNMTFSYYASLKGIPAPLRDAAAMNRLSRWRTFRVLELPASMIGLVWNSMMSMAGGWFFLTVNEAFKLGDKDFRLPGIGSYMAEAINAGDVPAMLSAVVAMVVMRLPKEVVVEELVIRLPSQDPEQLFDIVVGWGRYAELFGYEPQSELLYLSQPQAAGAGGES